MKPYSRDELDNCRRRQNDSRTPFITRLVPAIALISAFLTGCDRGESQEEDIVKKIDQMFSEYDFENSGRDSCDKVVFVIHEEEEWDVVKAYCPRTDSTLCWAYLSCMAEYLECVAECCPPGQLAAYSEVEKCSLIYHACVLERIGIRTTDEADAGDSGEE